MSLEFSSNRRTRTTRLLRAALPGLLLLSANATAHAQKLWDAGGGADISWFTATNWDGNTLPAAAENVVNNLNAAILFNGGSSTVNSLLSAGAFTLQSGTLTANAPGVSTFQVNNTFNLSGGTLSGFIVNAGSGGQGVTGISGTTIFNSVSLSANLSLTNASLRFQGGAFNSASVSLTNATLAFESNQTLNNTTINFNGASASDISLENANTSLVIGATTTLQGRIGTLGNAVFVGGSPRTITNNGTILSNASGQTTTITPTTFTNGATGVITATNGATVSFNSSNPTNQGLLQANNSGGTGGTLNLGSDTITNTGGTILAGDGGTVALSSTTINGGSLTVNATGILSFAGTTALNNVAFTNNVPLTLTNANLRLQGTTGLNSSVVNLSNAVLAFESSQTLNNTTINFNGASSSDISLENANTNLTIGSTTTLQGRIGTLGSAVFVGGSPRTITNNGTILSNVSGQTTTISPTTFTNGTTGTITATNGATVSFNSSNPTNQGLLQANNSGGTGGTLSLGSDTIANTGGTILAGDGGTVALSSTTINGGNLTVNPTGTLTFAGTTVLNNVAFTNNIPLTLTNASLRLQGTTGLNSSVVNLTNATLAFESSQTLNNTTINFNGASASDISLENNNTSLVIGATTTLQGRIGTLGGAVFVGGSPRTITNNGTILSNTSGQTTTISPSAFTNGTTGTVTATNGATVSFNTSTPINQGLLQANNSGGTGGTLNLGSDTITNTGGTILAGNGGTVTLSSTTINGGTLSSTGSGVITNAGTSTLDGVALSGTINAGGSTFRLQGNTGLTGANLTTTGGIVSIENSNVALTSGSISYNGATAGSLPIEGTGTSAVIGPNFTVSGRISDIGNVVFVGGTNRTLTNNGTLALNASGQATAITPSSFTNGATGAFLVTNGATATFNTANPLSNAGEILIGTSSAMSLGAGDTLNQTGGSTTVNGTLNATNGTSLNIAGGTLGGTGTINFTGDGGILNNTGGTVSPGASPGTLTVNGSYAQGAGGTLLVELGGTGVGQFDLLDISGAASLDGLLFVSLFGGFVPTVGQTFTIMEFGSRSGAFTGVSSLNTGFTYSVSYSPTAATLRVETAGQVATAAPEPGTIALLALAGLPIAGAAIRRRYSARR
jgi:hypothetical protein